MFLRVLLVMLVLGWGFLRLTAVAMPLLPASDESRVFLVLVEVVSYTILVGILMGTHFSRRCMACNKSINEEPR